MHMNKVKQFCLETLVEYRCLLEDNLCGINIFITFAPDELTRAIERALIIQSTS